MYCSRLLCWPFAGTVGGRGGAEPTIHRQTQLHHCKVSKSLCVCVCVLPPPPMAGSNKITNTQIYTREFIYYKTKNIVTLSHSLYFSKYHYYLYKKKTWQLLHWLLMPTTLLHNSGLMGMMMVIMIIITTMTTKITIKKQQ